MMRELLVTGSKHLLSARKRRASFPGTGFTVFVCLAALESGIGISRSCGAELDLSRAVIVSPERLSPAERNSIRLLIEEVYNRTLLRCEVVHTWPSGATPVIAVGQAPALATLAGPLSPKRLVSEKAVSAEGFQIRTERKLHAAGAVLVIGHDSRGVLFGVGRLLRELQMERGRAALAGDLNLTSSPRYPLRGHQLGYRPKTNSYDGWTLSLWKQYIRDLAVFGTNAVELIPPRSDDAADSPHFPLPPMEMMVGMSKLLDDHGLDVWIWYPALDKNYADPATVEFALREWGEVFRKLPRIDAVFVPGGDPGHTSPRHLLSLLEKETAVLHRYHPRAQMWVSPQGFTREWLDELYAILHKEQPAWLTGVVFGPQVRVSLAELRAAIPAKYPIRLYPDITHSLRCQYPVPDWDLAYALTEGREPINPRPRGQAAIFRASQGHAVGFITYSEGCNDDVNKMVWSSLGWDPDADVADILRQYSRYFLGERYRDTFAQGLLALERNWQGPLLTNTSVSTTLQQFQALERLASPQDRLKWRFQQALYRAYYDAYQHSRLIYETALEEQALDKLRGAARIGSTVALKQAEEVLDRGETEPIAVEWRGRVHELAEALFQSIRMQLSVERYQAIAVGRGANLDTIDVPLNNRLWLKQRFAELRPLPAEADRLKGIDALLHWTDPGPGGFYDNLGDLGRQPHLVREGGRDQNRAFRQAPLLGFAYVPGWRLSWCRHADGLFDTPLRMRYTDLDPQARYRVRIVYAGDNFRSRIRLLANDTIEVHPPRLKESPVRPVEFDIPPEATSKGQLTLTWYQESGQGGNGRGCQVAEVWLIRAR
jgi:hypothetical protein